jgi:hypothetical protein
MVIIPVDAHLLTLTITTQEIRETEIRVGRETQKRRQRVDVAKSFPTKRTAATLAADFAAANTIFAAANVEFKLRTAKGSTAEAPGTSEAIDDEGFLVLAGSYKANNGVSLMLVPRFAGKEGGAAVEAMGVCAVGDNSHANALPHELGHLLGLDHQGDIRDLMNPGLSPPGTPLTRDEIRDVKKSRLYRQFEGAAKAS